MYGLDNTSGINVMPTVSPKVSATPLWFTEGGAGQAPSYPGQDWFNMFQAELLNVLADAGIAPIKTDLTQLSKAIKKLITNENVGYLKAAGCLAEIKALGAASVATTLSNIGALPANGTAVSAIKLANARTIAGKSFDGTANITIAAGDVGALPSNGTAAAATKLATPRTIAGKSFDGTANISIGADDVGALPIAGGTLTGPLAINGTHSEPLGPGGYRSCLLTPANGGITNPGGAGIGLHSSGVIYFWNDNSGYAADLSPTLMSFRRPISSTGAITPGDYSNFDARYSKFGAGQAWTDVLSGRVSGAWYTNNTGKPIMISVTTDYGSNSALNCQTGSAGTIAYPRGGGSEYIQHNATFIVVPGDTYRVTAAGTIGIWKELR
ncbi:hypothetical protein OU751_003334 [Yersinia enterocolitica]|nr:hypothetical protein [Yersinia enterocolitica]